MDSPQRSWGATQPRREFREPQRSFPTGPPRTGQGREGASGRAQPGCSHNSTGQLGWHKWCLTGFRGSDTWKYGVRNFWSPKYSNRNKDERNISPEGDYNSGEQWAEVVDAGETKVGQLHAKEIFFSWRTFLTWAFLLLGALLSKSIFCMSFSIILLSSVIL